MGPERAFVAGATGYTGRAVVQAAVEAGIETVAHVRPDSPRLEQWRKHFEAQGAGVDATPWEAEAMTSTLRRVRPTLVFGLLGTTRARARRAAPGEEESYESVDYALTVMLLEAAVASGNSPRFVYLSSVGVGPKARGAYMSVRWRTEQKVRESGLSHAIARSSLIVGPDREQPRVGERLGALAGDAALAFFGALGARRVRDRYRSTTNVALARALVRIGRDRQLGDRVFQAEELRE
jgi:nucleoside-diphosphate-sugar epimerase